MPFQTLTTIRAVIAVIGVPSQLTVPPMWAWTATQLTTLKVGSNIQRHDQAERQLEHRRNAGIDERVRERLQEDAVFGLELVVAEPDEVADLADFRLRQRQPDPEDERPGQ